MRLVQLAKRWFSLYQPSNLDLETAENHIRIAWIAGSVSLALNVDSLIEGSNTTSIPDMVFLAIFVFGTYKRSVFCAVALVISKIAGFIWVFPRVYESMDVVSLAEFVLYAVAFAHCYYLGAVGAIRYKQLVRPRRKEPIETEVIGVVVAFGLSTMSLLTVGIPA